VAPAVPASSARTYFPVGAYACRGGIRQAHVRGQPRNLEDVAINQRLNLVKADIADRHAVDMVYRDYRPVWVVNFAAESHVDRSIDGPRTFIQTNTMGAFELLDGARIFLAQADERLRARFRFLHVSTDEVYGTLVKVVSSPKTPPTRPIRRMPRPKRQRITSRARITRRMACRC
jgi:dTDP-D-glucose 4,6-dehydratase